MNIDAVSEGLRTLLGMFKALNQPIFPRNIMTYSYSGFFSVSNLQQMYSAYQGADFKDCRISAYPFISKKAAAILYVPNLLLLDMDLDYEIVLEKGREYAKDLLKRKVNSLLKQLQQKYAIANLMILWTGNGHQVYIPFGFDKPLEHFREFAHFRDSTPNISQEFLIFTKEYLTKNNADKSNTPNFASMFFRIPGSINTKVKYGAREQEQIVKIEHKWLYDTSEDIAALPKYTDFWRDLIPAFIEYLADKDLKYKIVLDQKQLNLKRELNWIENLLTIAVADGRKELLRKVINPYLVAFKQIADPTEAYLYIKNWLEQCNRLEPLDPSLVYFEKNFVKADIANLGRLPRNSKVYPWSYNTFIKNYPQLRYKV